MPRVKLKDLRVGDEYHMSHVRFGTATVRLLEMVPGDPADVWLNVEVTKGELRGARDSWGVGDEKMVRADHVVFLGAGK